MRGGQGAHGTRTAYARTRSWPSGREAQLIQRCLVPAPEDINIPDGQAAQQPVLVSDPLPLPRPAQFMVPAEAPLSRVGHHAGPDHGTLGEFLKQALFAK